MESVGLLDRTTGATEQDSSPVALCLTVLGADLTAYLAGADTLAQFESWLATPALAGPHALPRIRAAAELIDALATYNQVSMAGPWLAEVCRATRSPPSPLRPAPRARPPVRSAAGRSAARPAAR